MCLLSLFFGDLSSCRAPLGGRDRIILYARVYCGKMTSSKIAGDGHRGLTNIINLQAQRWGFFFFKFIRLPVTDFTGFHYLHVLYSFVISFIRWRRRWQSVCAYLRLSDVSDPTPVSLQPVTCPVTFFFFHSHYYILYSPRHHSDNVLPPPL